MRLSLPLPRHVVLLGLLGAVLGVPPAQAAGQVALKLEGSRTAVVVVRFSREVTIPDPVAAVVSSRGSVGGFLVADESGRLLGGMIRTADSSGTIVSFRVGELRAWEIKLKPGRYRFTLIATTAAKVYVPVSGLSTPVTYTPVQPVALKVQRPSLSDDLVSTAGQARVPVTVTGRTVMLVEAGHLLTGTGGTFDFCVVRSGGACSDDGSRHHHLDYGVGPVAVRRYEGDDYTFLAVAPGRRDVILSTTVHGVAEEQRGLVVTVG